jgi:hypothetical protein
MEPELWAELSAAISAVQRRTKFNPRDTHPTALVIRVHLWAALHDRPTSWACDARHWTDRTRPAALPDQSTMSRRTRRKDFEEFLGLLGRRLGGGGGGGGKGGGGKGGGLVRVVDGKPLELPNHTTDPDAAWGRGVSRTSVGYKLHAVWRPGAAMPDASFAVTPLDACEKQLASRLAKRLGGGGGTAGGYLLGDAHYDASWLFDASAAATACAWSARAPSRAPGWGTGTSPRTACGPSTCWSRPRRWPGSTASARPSTGYARPSSVSSARWRPSAAGCSRCRRGSGGSGGCATGCGPSCWSTPPASAFATGLARLDA